jgi:Protein of unknown function (DUF2637)
MSTRQAPPVSPAVRVTTVAAVVVVALVAAVVSFSHMQTVAERAGERWRSWLIPASVDGLIVAASMVLLVRRRAGLPGGWLAWVALLGGVAASLACNIAAAEPTTTARLIAAWPPLAFAAAFELLLQQRRSAPVVEVVARVVEPVGEVTPTRPPVAEPATDRNSVPAAPVAPIGPLVSPPVAPVDPLAVRVAALVASGREAGRPVGRRTVARELGVSEHRASQLLAASNGRPS